MSARHWSRGGKREFERLSGADAMAAERLPRGALLLQVASWRNDMWEWNGIRLSKRNLTALKKFLKVKS